MTTTQSGAERLPVWLIVLACAAVAGLGMGLRQVVGLYQKPLTETLGIGREAFSISIAISNIVWGMAAPFAGGVSDKYGTGRVVLFGAICTAIGIYLMQAATSEMSLYIAGLLLGLGVAGAGVNAMVGAVGRVAPPEQRTAMIAKLGMGSGIGVLLAVPYTHLLMETVGWKSSLLVLAATTILMLPLAWIISKTPATPAPGVGAPKAQTLAAALKEAFAYPSFWLLNAGFFVCGFHVVFYGAHLPAYVADKGFGGWVAVWSLVVVGLGNLVGTYLAGQWGKVLPKRWGLCLIYLGRSIVFLGFLFLPITPTMVIVLSGLLGLFWLSTVPLTSSLVATFFGPTWMSMLYGIVFFSHQLGSFLGVWMAGRVFDLTKSYDMMWWISVAMGIFAALVHWPIREQSVPRPAVSGPAPVPAGAR
jgi:predicted MFS family arabinose efflux permease